MDNSTIIESIYQNHPEIKEHFILKILEFKDVPFFYLGIREDPSGKDLESLLTVLDEVFNQAEKYGFMNFVFSFKEVTYFGDLGYSTVVGFTGYVIDRGGKFILIEVNPKIKEVIKILGLGEYWPIYDSEKELLIEMNK